MHASFKTLGTLALISLAACGRKPAAELSPVDNVVATRWNANLTTPAAMQGIIQSEGRAWITSEEAGRRTRIDVELGNMVPGGEHPWVLRSGQCGMSGADLVRVNDGNRLKVSSDGKAKANMSSDMLFPSSGDYMLAVLASNENPDRIIACGNFAPPNMMPRR
jgi:predicted small lipoprotein YifL